jgi:putative nucleotidyltransferase with HDIG domain
MRNGCKALKNIFLIPRPKAAAPLVVTKPETDLGIINYRRLSVLMPFWLAIFYFMFALSLYIHEQQSLQVALGAMAIMATISQVLIIRFGPVKGESAGFHQLVLIDAFALSIMLWGATMVGYKPNAIIPYFDFLIAVVSVGMFLLLPDSKILALNGVTLAYTIFLTPILDRTDTNRLLLVISLFIFQIAAFLLSRAFYSQIMQNINLASLLYEQQQNLAIKVKEKSAALIAAQDNMSREVIRVLAKVLDDYDSYTRGHSENVARLSEMIAKRMGYSDDYQQQMFWAGMIHDIGKIRVPKHILNKAGKLTPDEFDKIKLHPLFGYEMIRESEALRPLADIVLSHHEHFDGSGHPNQTRGDQIPVAAQILAIADAWDAMLSRRIYRDALSVDHAKTELVRCSGKQFSPNMVNVFLMMVEKDPGSFVRADDSQYQSFAKIKPEV